MKKNTTNSVDSKETAVAIPFKAVIFDMDGTLIASTEADYLAWKRLFAEYGIDLTFEKYFPLLGKKSADVVKSRLHLEGDAIAAAMQKKLEYFDEVVKENGIQLIPYADVFVKSVKQYGVKMALATSSRKHKMERVMQLVGLLSYFDVTVTGNEIENGKPAPDIFIKAAGRLQVPPAECVVFEDAVSGVQAAKAAGMKCIAITTTHPAEALPEADIVIDSFEGADFVQLCRQLQKSMA